MAAFLIPSSSLLAAQSTKPKAARTGSEPPSAGAVCSPSILGSPFVPVDSWVYPAVWRLYALGYIDTVYLGIRPWTRASIAKMLEEAGARIEDADAKNPGAEEAESIYEALSRELQLDVQGPCLRLKGNAQVESVYTIARGITGTPLRDSFHLGATIVNDYGRPYESGML